MLTRRTIDLKMEMWRLATLCLFLFAATSASSSSESRISVDSDGGYTGIVVKIDRSVPETECVGVLKGIKVNIITRLQSLFLSLA